MFSYLILEGECIIEDKQDGTEEKVDNIIQTLKIVVHEGLIKNNGRIKKPYITKSDVS